MGLYYYLVIGGRGLRPPNKYMIKYMAVAFAVAVAVSGVGLCLWLWLWLASQKDF